MCTIAHFAHGFQGDVICTLKEITIKTYYFIPCKKILYTHVYIHKKKIYLFYIKNFFFYIHFSRRQPNQNCWLAMVEGDEEEVAVVVIVVLSRMVTIETVISPL